MRIVQLTTEFAPLAKAGGLGEVVTGLSKELLRRGHSVEVILPKYDLIPMNQVQRVHLSIPDFKCEEKGSFHANALWQGTFQEVPLSFIEARHPSGYFHRETIYGCEDDVARFLYFSKAALHTLHLRNQAIDVLHLHDWPVAIAAVLAKDLYKLPIGRIVLTLHNAAYQGLCASWDLDAIGLQGNRYLTPDGLQDPRPEYPTLINLLKGGILYSDAVVAVSPEYAREILTREAGYGLESLFLQNKKKIFGILNGLDQDLWNPGQDPFLPVSYNASDSPLQIRQAKEQVRSFLKTKHSLDPAGRPWVGAVTRLAHQKGLELIEEAIQETLRTEGSFLLLGTPSSPEIRQRFEALQQHTAHHSRLLICLEYREELAHQIYASLDFLVIPSLYEPCGLSQMIAMRYGTIPVARATGGLKDTISSANGFLFSDFTRSAVAHALREAFDLFHTHPAAIETLIRNAMRKDWSWNKAAEQYLLIYKS